MLHQAEHRRGDDAERQATLTEGNSCDSRAALSNTVTVSIDDGVSTRVAADMCLLVCGATASAKRCVRILGSLYACCGECRWRGAERSCCTLGPMALVGGDVDSCLADAVATSDTVPLAGCTGLLLASQRSWQLPAWHAEARS